MPELCKCGNPLAGSNCSVCGLPPDLCVCKTLEQQAQKIRISVEIRKFRKPTTIIEVITGKPKDILKTLKSRLACCGTYKENHIELQGNHKERAKQILLTVGYSADQIEVS